MRVRFAFFSATRRALISDSIRWSSSGSKVAQPPSAPARLAMISARRQRSLIALHAESLEELADLRGPRTFRLEDLELDLALGTLALGQLHRRQSGEIRARL